MAKSKIEWTDKVWNPVTGCSKISAGCDNCYAERMSKRFAEQWGLPKDDPFKVTKHDKAFLQPLRWKKPSKIFVCSMGDLFHEEVKERWIDGVFAIMGLTYDQKQRHTYMILTKRPERMREYIKKLVNAESEELRKRFYHFSMTACDLLYQAAYMHHMNASMMVASWIKNGMPGLWLGVTAENQEQADKRIPILLEIPAGVRFVSVEPMLGPVDLWYPKSIWPDGPEMCCTGRNCGCRGLPTEPPLMCGLDWVICGGESGPGARPMHPDWARSLRDQCQAAGVPYF
ncbi:MAG: DUF5131 family protein, partial [Sporomusa sp.]